MPIDFGVEVTRRFESEGEVRCVETPAGEAAVLRHRGPYTELPGAHSALHAWCAASGRTIGAYSLEVYGDWTDDPRKLDTTIHPWTRRPSSTRPTSANILRRFQPEARQANHA